MGRGVGGTALPAARHDADELALQRLSSPRRTMRVKAIRVGGKWMNGPPRDPDAQSPAGGVSSTARDLAQWLKLQLNDGKLDGRQIVNAEALARDPPAGHQPGFGVDRAGRHISAVLWARLEHRRRARRARDRSAIRAPSTSASAPMCALIPPRASASPCSPTATRSASPKRSRKASSSWPTKARSRGTGSTPTPGALPRRCAPDYGDKVDLSPRASATPALPPASYAGIYDSELYGPVEVVAGADGLVLKLGPQKQQVFPLRHVDRDTFAYQPAGENAYGEAAVTFDMAADQAVSVTIENLDITGQGTFARELPEK